jgi:tetratricopeptide (TPR) repeat protein
VLDDGKASKYARALALEAEGQIASGKQDDATAVKNFKDAYALDALPNNQQFQVLYNVAIIQIQSEKYEDALATLTEWFKVTGAQKAEAYALQGNAYYRLEKFQPAVDAIKKALSLSDKPSESWYQILMASYAELEQYDEAAKVLEQQLAKTPNDVKLTTQLATVYIKGKQDQKAIDLLAAAKQKGLLTSESDYKLMAQLYDQLEKPEGAAVLSEGFSKGISNRRTKCASAFLRAGRRRSAIEPMASRRNERTQRRLRARQPAHERSRKEAIEALHQARQRRAQTARRSLHFARRR